MRDPYTVLGVARTASEKEIKTAFRSLAKIHHPDSGKGGPGAKEKFAEISRAYEILGDKDKKAQFDRGEIDAEGKPKFQGFEGFSRDGGSPFEGFEFRGSRSGSPFGQRGFTGAEDILGEMFGGAFGGMRGSRSGGFAQDGGTTLDLKATAEVSVEDLARGKATIRLPGGKELSFALPAGAKDGQIVRLAGQGNKLSGARPGDALVTLKLLRHPVYAVDEGDLRMNAELPLEVAVSGGKIAVDTLDGRIALTIPAWTDSGKVFRLKGKGLPLKSGGHGDLLVTVMIRLPVEGRAALQQALNRG
jgi:DnaJ-class molecular chaperone